MSKIVLMGDSITEYMPNYYKGPIGNDGDEVKFVGVENIGVGSYMKYVWPKINHVGVDAYILLIGTNNISRPDCDYDDRETLDELVKKLQEFIDDIIKTNSRLIVQSIYPTKYLEGNDRIILVNKQIEMYCKEVGVEYLDLYSVLSNDKGLFEEKYTKDGIHPNDDGYELIANHINKKLNDEKIKTLKK